VSPQYPSHQYRGKPHRISIQSQVPTESTLSPFVSPTASSFKGEGLAPRPPSFPYAASEAYNKESLERRRRRASRNQDEEHYSDEIENTIPPPAAPEPPRNSGPPLSYKLPYSAGPPASYQLPKRLGLVQRPEISVDTEHLGDNPQRADRRLNREIEDRRQRELENREAKEVANSHDLSARGVIRRGTVDARRERPEFHNSVAQTRPRKVSLADTEAQRRREWAPDRSPLQRLELTLDSITKEEKRARVLEAELLAREAKAERGSERLNQNSVRFRNQPASKATVDAIDSSSAPEAGVPQKSSTKRSNLERSGSLKGKEPAFGPAAPVRSSGEREPHQKTPESENLTPPQSGSSSRQRAALPAAAAATAAVAIASGAGLVRSTSNKLKKQPPGDPWYKARVDAEKRYPEVKQIKSPPGTPEALPGARRITSDPLPPKKLVKSVTLAAPFQSTKRQISPHTLDTIELDSDEVLATPPVRRGSTKTISQLTGEQTSSGSIRNMSAVQQQLFADRLDRSEELGPTGSGQHLGNTAQIQTANRVKYAVPNDLAEGNHGQERSSGSPDEHHHFRDILHGGYRRSEYKPGDGLYAPPQWLDDWKNGGIAYLDGSLLDLDVPPPVVKETEVEKDKTWWEAGNRGKRRSTTTPQRAVVTYDGEYEDGKPTKFSPPLFLKCGPLLRYCGIRSEKRAARPNSAHPIRDREIWRGSVMIVTSDEDSSYEKRPTLRLFAQPVDLLPPPPAQVDGGMESLAPEYVDPLAGLPKVGRDGSTLYVRPVEVLAVGKDISRDETDDGLFEREKSVPAQLDGIDNKVPPARMKKANQDGERIGKFSEVPAIRLHAEQGVTFWRFNLEVELGSQQQRIAYRINKGPATGFWVPANGQTMNMMFYSCNGFSMSVKPDLFNGPDPMWRDVLNTHQTQPFHVMIGGGDQIYNDVVMKDTTIFQEWLALKNPLEKHNAPFTKEMQKELETFYLNRYCMWFSQGLFGLANSQIPMINMFDDHDIIDGWGSYPHHFMDSPTFSGLGAIAFKFYMLFQQQSVIDEGEDTEPSWLLGARPGPYMKEVSRSLFMSLGKSVAFLGLDCRTERTHGEVLSLDSLDRIFDRCDDEIIKGETKHLIVLLGVPIAYPRLVWLENM